MRLPTLLFALVCLALPLGCGSSSDSVDLSDDGQVFVTNGPADGPCTPNAPITWLRVLNVESGNEWIVTPIPPIACGEERGIGTYPSGFNYTLEWEKTLGTDTVPGEATELRVYPGVTVIWRTD